MKEVGIGSARPLVKCVLFILSSEEAGGSSYCGASRERRALKPTLAVLPGLICGNVNSAELYLSNTLRIVPRRWGLRRCYLNIRCRGWVCRCLAVESQSGSTKAFMGSEKPATSGTMVVASNDRMHENPFRLTHIWPLTTCCTFDQSTLIVSSGWGAGMSMHVHPSLHPSHCCLCDWLAYPLPLSAVVCLLLPSNRN